MTKTPRAIGVLLITSAGLLAASFLRAQQGEPSPAPRPPEGPLIINLPSADVTKPGTLTLLFTHRFSQPVQDSDIHSLFSFDSAADVKIGLIFSPLKNLEVSLERDPAHCFCGQGGTTASTTPQGLEIYELGGKYHFLSSGPVSFALRLGGDWRTARGLDDRSTFFAEAIIGAGIGSRVRITAVPMYVSKTSGQALARFFPANTYRNVFNVGGALSLTVTRSVNVHGEVLPRVSRGGARGVGWTASLEKTVLRHRFAFTIGNLRATTVDQYIASDFRAATASATFNPNNLHVGFNLVRQWNFK